QIVFRERQREVLATCPTRIGETFDAIADTYGKLKKVQDRRLSRMQKGEALTIQSERRYAKLKDELVELMDGVRLNNGRIEALVERNGLEVRAKLGWTDVAFFAERGVPASNFGPGDATIAHTQGEYVERAWVVDTHAALLDVITNGV
ncbi:MAG: hypothetical protein EBZ17_14875, partial [Actinobacteria bacterium]|nr:hypothetical protein [Actinomycetota bacterium]